MAHLKLIELSLQFLCVCIVLNVVFGQLSPITGMCYSNDSTPYRHYSTKTLYEDVRGGQFVREELVPGCEPSLFYLFARHGTRFPTEKWIKRMTNLPAVKQKILRNPRNANMCQEDINRIQSWNLRVRVDQAGRLAPAGYEEMESIAKRFQTRYPGLLRRSYSESEFHIRHTYSERTKQSAEGFVKGLFNTTENIKTVFKEKNQDRMLRYYEACSKYEKEIDDVDVEEQEKFIKSAIYSRMARNVTKRLGLSDDELTLDEIHVMHQACAFDHDIFGDAPWCAAFSEEDLKIIEYGEDLEYYYTNGYGAPDLAQDQTCELMKDVVEHLRNGEKSSSLNPKAALRFGHSGSFQPFLARLGLDEDSFHLTADNMASQMNRKWQTSIIAPFGANLAFVVYRCSGTTKVKTFHNEDPVRLPGCPDLVCELNTALAAIETFTDTCDFDKICETFSHGVKIVPLWQYTILVISCALMIMQDHE